MRKAATVALVLCLIPLLVIGFGYFGAKPWGEKRSVRIAVAPQATGAEIAAQLTREGVIMHPFPFKLALRALGKENALQAGIYHLETNSSVARTVEALQKGKPDARTVTIPEGFSIPQLAERLDKAGIAKKEDVLAAAKAFRPAAELQVPVNPDVPYPAEGFLFPSTYDVPDGSSVQDILAHMHNEFLKRLTPARRQAMQAQHLSAYETIVLASLVEREALLPEDRPIIAAVFRKRLAIGMPLQSCASIQFILGEPKQFLSLADTQIPSPYNTYLHTGLPPGPVAAPGEAALDAVLFAPATEYLYFVAQRDGRHRFSKTYEEHMANVDEIYGNEQ